MKGQTQLFNTSSMSSARAMRKLRREREIERFRLQRRNYKTDVCFPKDFAEREFNLTDEERNHAVRLGECPMCHYGPLHTMRVHVDGHGKKSYSIQCANSGCSHPTEKFPSSQMAIRNWKVIAALHK